MADKKGKAGSPDDIMAPAAMKPILAGAKGGSPASCALGLTKDKDGVLLLDRRRKPKALMAELKKQAASAGLELEMPTLRFGRAIVDAEQDASLLTLVVNKDAGGAMRSKMLERVKKAGFAKVEITVDASLENEAEEDQPAPPMAMATVRPQAPSPPPAPPPGPSGQDATTLTNTLTGLVKQMLPVIAADPTRANALKGFALQAQTSLKSGDVAAAANSVEALRRALNGAGTQPAAPAQPTPAVPGTPAPPGVHAKSRLAWIATRQKVEADLAKLKKGIVAACNGKDIEAALEAGFSSRVEPVLGKLDDSLAHKLDEVNKATDPAQRAKLLSEAKQIVQRYESYVASEPIIAKLDANPFVPLALRKTLTATLTTLSTALR